MVNCILLLSLCFTILVQAIKRLISIEPIDRTRLRLYIIVGVIGLVINIMALAILGGKRHRPVLLIYSKTPPFCFSGDMAHGHSHGGGGGHSHGSKSKKDRKKDEDALETGDVERLCGEEGAGHDHDDHHGHSHSPTSIQTGYSRVNNDVREGGDTKSKKEKKKGCKTRVLCTSTYTFQYPCLSSGWWSDEYSRCFSPCPERCRRLGHCCISWSSNAAMARQGLGELHRSRREFIDDFHDYCLHNSLA